MRSFYLAHTLTRHNHRHRMRRVSTRVRIVILRHYVILQHVSVRQLLLTQKSTNLGAYSVYMQFDFAIDSRIKTEQRNK